MNKVVSITLVALSDVFYGIRSGFFGETTIEIRKDEQGGENSYGKNWFQVNRGILYDEVEEMEDWACPHERRVQSFGWSLKPIKLVLLKE